MPTQHAAPRNHLIQLHLSLPYKIEIRRHPRIRSLLEQGYRIAQLQRINDREVIATLSR